METVATWMERAVETASWRAFDDLHIDEAYPDIHRDQWVGLALRLFEAAIRTRDTSYPAFAVVLGFSLNGLLSDCPSETELGSCMDWSPPSVYVFADPSGELSLALSDASPISMPSFLAVPCRALRRQWADADGPHGSLLFVSHSQGPFDAHAQVA